jgi:hypothetical protein
VSMPSKAMGAAHALTMHPPCGQDEGTDALHDGTQGGARPDSPFWRATRSGKRATQRQRICHVTRVSQRCGSFDASTAADRLRHAPRLATLVPRSALQGRPDGSTSSARLAARGTRPTRKRCAPGAKSASYQRQRTRTITPNNIKCYSSWLQHGPAVVPLRASVTCAKQPPIWHKRRPSACKRVPELSKWSRH